MVTFQMAAPNPLCHSPLCLCPAGNPGLTPKLGHRWENPSRVVCAKEGAGSGMHIHDLG